MKAKKQKINWKRTWQNNIYMLRLIYKACPGILLVSLLTTIFGALHSFLLNTYLYKYALNAFQEGKELKEILTVIGVMSALQIKQGVLSKHSRSVPQEYSSNCSVFVYP